ncbi:MAG: transporter substrate-binding domain-containing protein [Gammaproteobacteria bacterium]|nr:transporter substrate-binding domain-containing protein [Gammaproteobacteria bacterium]
MHYPPYIIKGDDGQVSGVFVDLVSRAFTEMGYQPRFNISNWARAYAAIQSG